MRGGPRTGVAWALATMFIALANWQLAAAAGVGAPIWLGVAVGFVLSLASLPRASSTQGGARLVLLDASMVLLLGALAPAPVHTIPLLAACAAAALAGWASDKLLRGLGRGARMIVALSPLALVAALSLLSVPGMDTSARQLRSAHGRFTLVPAPRGERVMLDTGAVAWLDRVGSERGAVLFHGANPEGSQQRAALALRRALVGAGYSVLAVDHPGYGQSPGAHAGSPLEAWDPLPTALAAVSLLERKVRPQSVLLVGHSMGCTEVLRLLAAGYRPQGALLFGAGLPDPADRDAYWHLRFHEDRRLKSSLTAHRVKQILARYYNSPALLQALAPDVPEIGFVTFEYEHKNIAATRDAYYGLLPEGRKRRHALRGSDHYCSSRRVPACDLLLGDSRVQAGLVDVFRQAAP